MDEGRKGKLPVSKMLPELDNTVNNIPSKVMLIKQNAGKPN